MCGPCARNSPEPFKFGRDDFGSISSERICLKPIEFSDLQQTIAWRNKDRVRPWFVDTRPITAKVHAEWFLRYTGSDNDYVFIICRIGPGKTLEPIGQISIYNVNRKSGSALLGRMMIGEDSALRQGFAREAVRLLVDWSRSFLNLSELRLYVKGGNSPAIGLYESCNFKTISEENGLTLMEMSLGSET